MGLIDLGHGVKVMDKDRTYFKVLTGDESMIKRNIHGKAIETPVTIRANVKHALDDWPISDVQKDIIKAEAKITLRRLSKNELLQETGKNGMSSPGMYEYISPEDAVSLFQENVEVKNAILRTPDFLDAVQEALKKIQEQGDGSLLDAVMDNQFENVNMDEDVNEEDILKEELSGNSNESEADAGATGDAPPKVREAVNKKDASKAKPKGGRPSKGTSPGKTYPNAVSK